MTSTQMFGVKKHFLKREVNTFLMSKNFSVLFYSSENTEKNYFSFHKNIKQLIFSTLKIIIIINNGAQNQHIKMISDGSCDTEVMAAENSALSS